MALLNEETTEEAVSEICAEENSSKTSNTSFFENAPKKLQKSVSSNSLLLHSNTQLNSSSLIFSQSTHSKSAHSPNSAESPNSPTLSSVSSISPISLTSSYTSYFSDSSQMSFPSLIHNIQFQSLKSNKLLFDIYSDPNSDIIFNKHPPIVHENSNESLSDSNKENINLGKRNKITKKLNKKTSKRRLPLADLSIKLFPGFIELY
ncbi:uncharacterized protein ASCRUDRAFT_75526 [Ascoidea rubescens DSM 1968]|uniref:Uncharacterized protein n=1 Tax=Ascoidea rubescens DSM 1968 TaxID=1344418 RepID=A0A1D2VIT0_9ASCO|nr:hypothetical protein ASCRUDRAFT_75526 [Ascoidea rubescens DSM 1968]ODV61528.1 hypothetical protein ASCRUDRAFT_75526 [Ascoidea rubescens DSM 1968]